MRCLCLFAAIQSSSCYAIGVFQTRSLKPERIDTGNYTPDEYAVFLSEIAFINKYFGDSRALKKTLLNEIERQNLRDFSVLDVGAGSGELLRSIAKFAANTDRKAQLTGIDLNEISAAAMRSASLDFPDISPVRGDALQLPFADDSFDFVISSLFFHHLADNQIVVVLKEMTRVARRGIYVIDLHRHPLAYVLYKLFCVVFRISPLVRHDGSLSILRGFKPNELLALAGKANLQNSIVESYMPYRLVLQSITAHHI